MALLWVIGIALFSLATFYGDYVYYAEKLQYSQSWKSDIVSSINEIETAARGSNSDYALSTTAQN